MDERIKDAASTFLLQSPPGEINDVLNDVRNIISVRDEVLQDGVLPALREYNLAQFITVKLPGVDHQTIISDAARDTSEEEQERFLDPQSKNSFVFDHWALEASDLRPFEPNNESEPFRSALESATLSYVSAHYLDGVATVLAQAGGDNQFVIQVVANKYNPTNYWSGRWRSEYIIDMNEHKVNGRILVTVHYYEQGNVQLATNHTISFSLPPVIISSPPNVSATKILALIEDEESKYQSSLNETYQEMGEKTFKGLRRALPLTRQKIDWDKVLGYKLGADLSSSKSLFGNA